MKEDWVLYDSFKRSLNIINMFADKSPFPAFVVDSVGKILNTNSRGKALLKAALSSAHKRELFIDLVHPNEKENILVILKSAAKEGVHEINSTLLVAQKAEQGIVSFNDENDIEHVPSNHSL